MKRLRKHVLAAAILGASALVLGPADRVVIAAPPPATLSRISGQYAPPFAFGPSQVIASHIGSVGFEVNLEPLGNGVIVIGELTYFNEAGKQRIVQFRANVHIVTGGVANVKLRLKTAGPTGSMVHVTVSP